MKNISVSITSFVLLFSFFIVASTHANSTNEVIRSTIPDMSISSSEIMRIATATPEVSRAVAVETSNNEETFHGSAPLPARLIQTGTSENIALLIFSLLLMGTGVVIERRK